MSPSPRPTPTTSPAPGPLPGTEPGTARVSGGSRTGTAVNLSTQAFPDGANQVFVATAAAFADALAAGPAAARQGGPVLLVDRDALPDATRAEIERLGARRIVVLGGIQAVSTEVEIQLAALGADVERLSGGDRYSTAAAVSRSTFPERVGVAYIATGDGFADALSGGVAAARNDGPVLLVNGSGVPQATHEELQRLSPRRIVVLGGNAAVPADVAAALDQYTDGEVERVSGPDRYATSAAISARVFPDPVDTVYVATGENFPDALAAVPAAAKERAPLLLVRRDDVPDVIATELARLRPRRIVILGGDAAVSAATAEMLEEFVVD
ncbi:MAG TPA: cell wall-binding repeat-containing protein [Pilimelia sp.]|nr:cell wall-binding repeat-containing protein [Pilimelia sp.]